MRAAVCGSTFSLYAPMASPPSTARDSHGCKAKRVFTPPALPKVFVPHWNQTVGKYVRSMAEFKSELSRGSDEASERVGTEHKYVVADPDAVRASVGDETLEPKKLKARIFT